MVIMAETLTTEFLGNPVSLAFNFIFPGAFANAKFPVRGATITVGMALLLNKSD